MLVRHARSLTAAVVLSLSFATAAGAVVLWDQSTLNATKDGTVNLVSSSCSQISGNTKVHTAMDVHFDNPVTITNVRIYETPGNVQAATQAYLWIAPKTGPLPTASSTTVEAAANLVTITPVSLPGGQVIEVSANNLNIGLPAGDYWVSLTPRHSLGVFPYTWHIYAVGPVVNDPTPAIVACTVNSNWVYPLDPQSRPDYSIKIEGTLPVPTLQTSWSRVKSIYR
jgi:hypothetical protein